MKKSLLFLFVILFTLSCGGKLKIREPHAVIRHMGTSTVALMAEGDEGNQYPFCTGVWVNKNTILTANHCVDAAYERAVEKKLSKLNDEEREVEIKKLEEMTHAAKKALVVEGTIVHYIVEGDVSAIGEAPFALRLGKVIVVDPEHDLAMIEAGGSNLPSHDIAVLATQYPAIGEKIAVVGQPKGLYWSFVEGTVAAYRDTVPAKRSPVSSVNEIPFVGPYVQVSGPVWFGNSGGGVFDTNGELIGIASFLTGMPHSCYFIHGDSIRKLLKDHKIQ